jgi:hypothetical protein
VAGAQAQDSVNLMRSLGRKANMGLANVFRGEEKAVHANLLWGNFGYLDYTWSAIFAGWFQE